MPARSLTSHHMAKVVQKREGEVGDPVALNPDEMRLYSFYKPSLAAADYLITVSQTITTSDGNQSLEVRNTLHEDTNAELAPQKFQVVVPRFSLDPNLINSYYPPDGHQDEGRILPHIVLNDPHYPWEILAGDSKNIKGLQGKIDLEDVVDDQGNKSTKYRSMVPWIALVVFDPEELRLPTLQDITALSIPGYSEEKDVQNQNPKGTFQMSVADYLGTIPKPCRINYKAGFDNDDDGYTELTLMQSKVDVIFPSKDLFNSLFASAQDTDEEKFGVEAHKYMAHVRHIKTDGFPDAGVEEDGLFSIVISSRTGQYDKPQPCTQICHLVSIEQVDSTLGAWMNPVSQSSPDRMGMVSLFSWIYTALPPNPVNFVDTVRNLTSYQQMLRIGDDTLANLGKSNPNDGGTKDQVSQFMMSRLKQGYTIARWRTQSGEETAAWTRGPLVPQRVRWPIADDFPDSSNTSQEYQILDPQTGLMDLTYSSAWQVGKLLAISDTVFAGALMRFRSAVHNSSAHQTRMIANQMSPKSMVLRGLKEVVNGIQTQSSGSTGDPQRFRPPSTRTSAPNIRHEDVKQLFMSSVKESVTSNSSAGDDIYNEFNLNGPNNSDWVIIHDWLKEKLFLGGIPPQYLLPEPSFLPPESLRYFHIDDSYLDALLDGALSVANHLDADDDVVRREIKETFNTYLRQIVPRAGYKPQIPSYGFLIRSKLIKAMPDLRITVVWKAEGFSDPPSGTTADGAYAGVVTTDPRAPVCRWTKWDDETLMCLLDRQPEELDSITLAQPPHQQRFSLGSYLTHGSLTFDLRRLYTTVSHPVEWPEMPMSVEDRKKPNGWIDYDTRVLKATLMAEQVNEALQFGPNEKNEAYTDKTPNSCVMGLELNDPCYYFEIVPPSHSPIDPRDRQLWTHEKESLTVKGATARFAASPTASKPTLRLLSKAKAPATAPPQAPVAVSSTAAKSTTQVSSKVKAPALSSSPARVEKSIPQRPNPAKTSTVNPSPAKASASSATPKSTLRQVSPAKKPATAPPRAGSSPASKSSSKPPAPAKKPAGASSAAQVAGLSTASKSAPQPTPPRVASPPASKSTPRPTPPRVGSSPTSKSSSQTSIPAMKPAGAPSAAQVAGSSKSASKPTPASKKPAAAPSQAQKDLEPTPKPGPKSPNNQLRIQPIARSRTVAGFVASGPITISSQFELTIFPDYKGPPTRFPGDNYDPDDYIPTINEFYFDLVFNIRKTFTATKSSYNLLRIDIDIPVQTKPPSTTDEALLMPDYDGPGLRMLSNQRFIPFLFYTEIQAGVTATNNLHIELRPRSADSDYAMPMGDSRTHEVSFRLAEASICQISPGQPVVINGLPAPVKRGKVLVTMTEWYQTASHPTGEPVSSTYAVLKRRVNDDAGGK